MNPLEAMKANMMTSQKKSSQVEECSCELCNGTGWILTFVDGKDYAKECPCGLRQKQIMERKLQFANIPEAFKDYTLKDFKLSVYKNPESKEIVRASCEAIKYWLDNLEEMETKGKGLYIYSDAKGSGKTRMAASIANELITKYRKSVKFATSVQILEEIRASWDSEEENEAKLLSELARADYLVIDDFGVEAPKDWVKDRFYSIINKRYIAKKPTIFTSNYTLSNLNHDERITNRILEMCFLIPFAEESVRQHIADQSKKELWEEVRNDRKD